MIVKCSVKFWMKFNTVTKPQRASQLCSFFDKPTKKSDFILDSINRSLVPKASWATVYSVLMKPQLENTVIRRETRHGWFSKHTYVSC